MDYYQKENLKLALAGLEGTHWEENQAAAHYRDLATKATDAGDYSSANVLRHMAEQEEEHHIMVGSMIEHMRATIQEAETAELEAQSQG